MRIRRELFIKLFSILLILSMLAVPTATALAEVDKAPSVNPDFLALVQEYPDETFRVIVQKDAKNKDLKDMELEDEVRKEGGKVLKELGLIVSFAAEMTGKEVEKMAKNPKVRWISPDAPAVSTGVKPGKLTYLDEFNSSASFSGSDGTESWTNTPWVEFGVLNGPGSGEIQVLNDRHCVSGYCLELECDDLQTWGVYRPANLDGIASATLTFQYKRVYESTTGNLFVQVSSDGGATWAILDTLALDTSDSDHQSAQYDLAPYASADTVIRFIGTDDGHIHIDNLQIEFSYPSPFRDVIDADDVPLDGQGVTVAVVDSGITDHMDLRSNASNPTQALNSASRVIQNLVFGDYDSPNDEYAHGNHVAGIIGGNGVASGGEYVGIAPGVSLINIRVSNDEGMTYTSDIIDSMQWILENKDTYNIRVLNLSITSTMPESYNVSALCAAVEILWFNGITIVTSAGNNGTADGPSTLYPPANDPFIITVGALEDNGTVSLDDDFVGVFSAYGTTEDGFAKPDVIAPGRNVISLLANSDATAHTSHPKHHVDDFYFRMSGTSMAAPVVSGVVALMLQETPGLTPDQIKYRLMYTASKDWAGYNAASAGAGTVNAYYAVYKGTTSSANLGIIPSLMLATGDDAVAFDSVGWNSVGWNSVGWNSVGWNSVGWNSVGWNSVGWNSVGWNTNIWSD